MKRDIVIITAVVVILLICRYVDIPCTIVEESASILMYSIFWLPAVLILYLLSRYKSQSKISKIIATITYLAVLFWVLNIAFTFSSCGNIDHSEDIKAMAVPMQKELENFYQQNKRFPTTIERNDMLEKVGCKMEKNVCVYKRDRMKITNQATSYNYTIDIDLENTGCYFSIQANGNHNQVSCGTNACIDFGQ